jgi:hypothetical protein
VDIDWSRYNTDPASAGFALPGGVYVHVYLMPWKCLDNARDIAAKIGAVDFYVSCVGGDPWSYTMAVPGRARRARDTHD